jgi:hypothetical protein
MILQIVKGPHAMPELHPEAPHHIHWFITAPGETDGLYVFTTLLVIASIAGLGVLFFTLHSLPERWGHKKMQFEIVAILGLISLFTHIHLFWVIALILALIDLPDFTTPLKRIARSSEKLAGIDPPSEEEAGDGAAPAAPADIKPSEQGA